MIPPPWSDESLICSYASLLLVGHDASAVTRASAATEQKWCQTMCIYVPAVLLATRYWFISWIYIIWSGKWFILICVPLLHAFATCLCYMPLLWQRDSSEATCHCENEHWSWSVACLCYYENAIRDSSAGASRCLWKWFVLICVPLLREHDSSAAARCHWTWSIHIFCSYIPLEMMNLRAAENGSSTSVHVCIMRMASFICGFVPLKTIRPHLCTSTTITWFICSYVTLELNDLQQLSASTTRTWFICSYAPLKTIDLHQLLYYKSVIHLELSVPENNSSAAASIRKRLNMIHLYPQASTMRKWFVIYCSFEFVLLEHGDSCGATCL